MAGNNLISLATPATQAIQKAKSQNLRGKQTERVSDKTNQNSIIQAEVIHFDEANEANTQRVLKEEEVKNGRIREEQESDNENGTEHRSAQKKSPILDITAEQPGQEDAAEQQEQIIDDPEKNLPASATEVQPPEMGAATNNDNMETIQQREEAQPAVDIQEVAGEEDKNNEE